MTTSTVPAVPVPVRSGLSQVPGVLAAVAGRWAWRLWWPLVPWLVAAAWAWMSLSSRPVYDGEGGTWSTAASGVLLLAGLVAIPVLWMLGARFALGLGHDRATVFAATAVVAVVLQAALHLVSSSVALLEHRAVGEAGLHVFAIESMDKFGTWDSVWNSSWYLGFWFVLPVIMVLIPASTALLRWGAIGVLGLVLIPVALGAVLVLMFWAGLSVYSFIVFDIAALVLAWFIFKRVAI